MAADFGELEDVMVYFGHGKFVLKEATRFEIYAAAGSAHRVLTLEAGAELHLQDDGRTVKIFTKSEADAGEWVRNSHDWGKAL